MEQKKIKVLVVEDSPTARELLLYVLSKAADLQVIGMVHNGAEALAAVQRERPDVVTMDIQMPRLDGYEATRAIMESAPVPIIIVSNNMDHDEVATTFRALEAGAVMTLRKPAGPGHAEYEQRAEELITALRLMAEVKVVRRRARRRSATAPLSPLSENSATPRELRAIALGASTGGPLVLQQILRALPAHFPVPVLVVQHMADGFINGMAEWLDQSCALRVRLAQDNELAQPGCVYLAPDGSQFGITGSGRLRLQPRTAPNGFCPSVSHLFHSVAAAFGGQAVGVLLTGMGDDGVSGLLALRQQGALTIAQDERSSVVFGMPGEAIRLQAAERVLSPAEIPAVLLAVAGLS